MDIGMPRKVRYLILIINVSFIAVCILLDTSLLFGFCLAILITAVILMYNGFALNNLFEIVAKGIKECSRIIVIILLIGALISMWMASGTVPAMIYYGLNFMKGTNLPMVGFLISAGVSIIMGTPLGTINTIGIALLAIGKGASIPVPMLLGAIVSGAFIGDKISPVSGLLNLTVKACGSDYRQCSKDVIMTLIPIATLCSIACYLLGLNYKADVTPSVVNMFQSSILSSYYISPVLLLLPAVIIVLSIVGTNITMNMGIGIVLGAVISVFLQGIGIPDVIKIILYGYKASTGTAELNAILIGGGVLSMIELVLIIAGAVVLSSLLQGANTINPIIDGMLKNVRTQGGLIKKTTILSSILTLITTDQTVGIIILGKSMQKKYEDLNINKSVLARTIIDTGVSIPPIIPWNITSIIITAITGVTVWEYGPYAILCYISPMVTVFIGYLNKGQFNKLSSKF